VSKDNILASNFFELFELPVSYDVDLTKLQQQYMKLQKLLHPDRFANSSDQQKRLSMQQTSWVNEAQATLKDPVLRAVYLLKLNGIDINLENETTMDAGFLMQQLELRERLEQVRKNFNNTEDDPLAVLESIAKELKNSMNEMMQGFAESYAAGQFGNAREWIRKLQFMKKATNEVNALAANIEDELMN
jgi:molecular chaperone HscB